MPHGSPLGAVCPEIVAVLVQDEKLAWRAEREHPFPLGHDRLARADHAADGVLSGR